MKSVIKINADGRMFDKDPDVNFDPYSVNSPLTDGMRKRLKTKYKTKENKNFRKYRDYIFFAGLIFAVLMIIFTF